MVEISGMVAEPINLSYTHLVNLPNLPAEESKRKQIGLFTPHPLCFLSPTSPPEWDFSLDLQNRKQFCNHVINAVIM